MVCMRSLIINFVLPILLATSQSYATSSLELQKKGDQLREAGQSLQAIDIYNQAIVQYQYEGDYSSMLESLTGRLLAWKHLFYKTQDKIYAFFVKNDVESMLEIINEHKLLDKLYLVYYLQGNTESLLKNYPGAEKAYSQALKLYPYDNAERGNWMTHLGDILYKNGKKVEGKRMMLQGIAKIQEKSSEVDSFFSNVWLSGAYLNLAKILQIDEPEESKIYLKEAEKIINSDKQLVIRKQQLDDFMGPGL